MSASQTATKFQSLNVLLIDDNPSTNFLHARVLRNSGLVASVNTCTSGTAALEYLDRATSIQADFPQPDLIFLDINMPGMSGWEFIDNCQDLLEKKYKSADVVLLTSSLNPDDEQRAQNNNQIKSFQEKPLRLDDVQRIVEGRNV